MNFIARLVFQSALMVTICSICIILFAGVIEPYQRGFNCDDSTIRKIYYENTITQTVLLSVTLFPAPLLALIVLELITRACQPWYKCILPLYLDYLFGFIITIALMHIGKSSVGALRPHFIAVCSPNWTAIDCSDYVPNAHCMSEDRRAVREARESFPSGHSAAAFLVFTFWLLYSRARCKKLSAGSKSMSALLNVFTLALFCASSLTALSRYTDNWHHPIDIAGGSALGVVIGYIVFGSTDGAFQSRLRNSNTFTNLAASD